MVAHGCKFPEIEILEDDGVLKKGMKVLAPCPECENTPGDYQDFMNARETELQAALLAVEPLRVLYHWAPTARRKQITRYGLRPNMRPSTSAGEKEDRTIPYICFADSPSWAWALSGGMSYSPTGVWDLWMTWQDRVVEPIVSPTSDRHTGIYEIRTEHRVYKRDIWYVGSRMKGPIDGRTT